jgi:hypothetical protein
MYDPHHATNKDRFGDSRRLGSLTEGQLPKRPGLEILDRGNNGIGHGPAWRTGPTRS